MTKSKNTKRALLASVLSMMLCVAMLAGSTFAWFTDTVSTGVNKIVTGNLDVELEYAVLDENGQITGWKSVEDETLFDENALWEPGYTQVVYLKVKNVGSLSLNYKLDVTVAKEHPGTNRDDQDFYLSKYLNFGAVTDWDGIAYADRAAAREAIGEAGNLKNYSAIGSIKAGESEQYIALVVYMPEETTNVANHKSNVASAVPYIELGISLSAHQMVDESDSFGNDYDENAFQANNAFAGIEDESKMEFTVSSEKDLLKLVDLVHNGNTFEGKTITLANNIALTQENWKPIGEANAPFMGTFDGGSNTISGLNITKADNGLAGLFGSVKNATVKNLTVNGEISLNEKAQVGAIVAESTGNVTVSGCTSNVNITGNVDGINACGIAIGTTKGGYALTIERCTNAGDISVTGSKSGAAGITPIVVNSTGAAHIDVVECVHSGKVIGSDGAKVKDGPYMTMEDLMG